MPRCDSLLRDAIDALNAQAAEVRTMSTIANNGGPQVHFAHVRRHVEDALSALREAVELYQGHLREHFGSLPDSEAAVPTGEGSRVFRRPAWLGLS